MAACASRLAFRARSHPLRDGTTAVVFALEQLWPASGPRYRCPRRHLPSHRRLAVRGLEGRRALGCVSPPASAPREAFAEGARWLRRVGPHASALWLREVCLGSAFVFTSSCRQER